MSNKIVIVLDKNSDEFKERVLDNFQTVFTNDVKYMLDEFTDVVLEFADIDPARDIPLIVRDLMCGKEFDALIQALMYERGMELFDDLGGYYPFKLEAYIDNHHVLVDLQSYLLFMDNILKDALKSHECVNVESLVELVRKAGYKVTR